jgi:DNA-binding transcriptional LysR family regulator
MGFRKLEELGLQLIDRIGHKSAPTAAGEIVYRRALALLAMRDDLVSELDELRGLKRGELRLGVPAVGGDALFAPIFAAYRKRYPGIDVRLIEHGSRRLQDALRDGDVDLAGLLLPLSDEFDWQEMRREPIVALVARNHAFAARKNVDLKALEKSPFILFEAGFALNAIILDACRQSGFNPDVTGQSTQISFILKLVGAGLGVAFLPHMIADLHGGKDVRALDITEPRMEWHMALAWRRGGYLSQAARAWLDLAQKLAKPRAHP